MLLKNIISKKRFQTLVSNSVDFIFVTVLTLPGILSETSARSIAIFFKFGEYFLTPT